jgi:hypothetical protein
MDIPKPDNFNEVYLYEGAFCMNIFGWMREERAGF